MTSKDIITQESLEKAIRNKEFQGFETDYLVLDSLLRKYKPKSVFEIGTNMGRGTKIIKNAVGDNNVYSLDLPTELAHISLQHPINEGHGDSVGHLCDLPFTQFRGDSMNFDYSLFPCDAYFLDGEHDWEHPYHETKEVAKLLPSIIIWHDSDIPEVWAAINDGLKDAEFWNPNAQYDLVRVEDCRVSYALKR